MTRLFRISIAHDRRLVLMLREHEAFLVAIAPSGRVDIPLDLPIAQGLASVLPDTAFMATLAEEDNGGVEYERKFLCVEPPLEGLDWVEIVQAYFASGPQGAFRVRFKRSSNGQMESLLTAKGPKIEGRALEVELAVDPIVAQAMMAHTKGLPVRKTRYLCPHGAYTIEIDVFTGHLDGLVMAEVENPDGFQKPDWMGADITDDKRFENGSLAMAKEAPHA